MDSTSGTTGLLDSQSSSSSPTSKVSPADTKISNDLNVLSQKMDLCESLLVRLGNSNDMDVDSKQQLFDAVGFLDACGPRMVELVEVAAQGALSEQVLMQALEVNDRLTKLLSDYDHSNAALSSFNEVPVDAGAASMPPAAAPPPPTPATEDPLSLLEEDDHQKPAAAASIPQTKSEDEFDSFFHERQGGAS